MIYSADGDVIEPRATLPTRNVHLKDGRILRHLGAYPVISGSGVWQCSDGLRVIGSVDENQHGHLLHISVSYQDKDPSWEDIKQVRYAFYGDEIDCMMVLPKLADYVNLHPHAFHLWQTPTQWNVL
jgi:hypothetical protein